MAAPEARPELTVVVPREDMLTGKQPVADQLVEVPVEARVTLVFGLIGDSPNASFFDAATGWTGCTSIRTYRIHHSLSLYRSCRT